MAKAPNLRPWPPGSRSRKRDWKNAQRRAPTSLSACRRISAHRLQPHGGSNSARPKPNLAIGPIRSMALATACKMGCTPPRAPECRSASASACFDAANICGDCFGNDHIRATAPLEQLQVIETLVTCSAGDAARQSNARKRQHSPRSLSRHRPSSVLGLAAKSCRCPLLAPQQQAGQAPMGPASTQRKKIAYGGG